VLALQSLNYAKRHEFVAKMLLGVHQLWVVDLGISRFFIFLIVTGTNIFFVPNGSQKSEERN